MHDGEGRDENPHLLVGLDRWKGVQQLQRLGVRAEKAGASGGR